MIEYGQSVRYVSSIGSHLDINNKEKGMHIGEKIHEVVKERKISVPSLAEALCCTRKNVYKMFQKESVNTALLMRVSEVLHYDFFAEHSLCLHFRDSLQGGDKETSPSQEKL